MIVVLLTENHGTRLLQRLAATEIETNFPHPHLNLFLSRAIVMLQSISTPDLLFDHILLKGVPLVI